MKSILKYKKTILIIIICLLLPLIIFSFAFFIAGSSSPAVTDTNIATDKTSKLILTPGNPINLVVNKDTFGENDGSLTGETTSTATLVSSTTEATVTDEYFVYYNVTFNDYIYTHNENTPEIILEITDNNGDEITSLNGLSYVTVTDELTGQNISGFDVTTYEGLITIKENVSISATSPNDTTHNWKIKITYVNLATDQIRNLGKTFIGELLLKDDSLSAADFTLTTLGYTDEEIIEIKNKPEPSFDQMATTNEGLFAAHDDYGISYYYRGAVDNNWVKFAGFYWRIVRINGDSSIRMIYSGTTQPTASQAVVMTGTGTQINTAAFNTTYSSAEYAGYMHTIGEQHGTSTSSNAKTIIDDWYIDNIYNTYYYMYISDAIYCSDRTAYIDKTGMTEASGIGTSTQYFGAVVRNETNKTPTLECPVQADAFTVDDKINGNGALSVPIGLLTADESAFAGGSYGSGNSNFYLYTANTYWTTSPYNKNGDYTVEFVVSLSGSIGTSTINNAAQGFRPVISIKPDTIGIGSGTWDDPYRQDFSQ